MELIHPRRGAAPASCGQAGMSLVEVVLASLILLLIAIGILPMFTRSMASNVAGSDSTYLSNMAVERAEELLQLPYDSPDLTVPDGLDSLVVEEVYTAQDEAFILGTAATARSADKLPVWTRVTTVQQFNVNDLTTPVPGTPVGFPDQSATVKQIEVAVSGLREGGPLGVSRSLTVRVLKAQ